jgi:hypothetical protein
MEKRITLYSTAKIAKQNPSKKSKILFDSKPKKNEIPKPVVQNIHKNIVFCKLGTAPPIGLSQKPLWITTGMGKANNLLPHNFITNLNCQNLNQFFDSCIIPIEFIQESSTCENCGVKHSQPTVKNIGVVNFN